jgi:thioredoxin-like negative regulator of GroEL
MKRLGLAAMALAAALHAGAQTTAPTSASGWRGYDETADARLAIEQARAQAAPSGKRVLIVFGANWCGDCRVLDTAMKQGRLKALLDGRFVVVKVDVGRFDRNDDIARRYGVPLKKGIPTVAVLAADGSASFVTSGGELADARSMGEDALVAFFDRPF